MPIRDRNSKQGGHWLIKIISLIVPRRLRPGWKREWNAEMTHRWSTLHEWQQGE